MSEPVQVKKRAIDVTPYEHGIWCSVEGGVPFVNTIVLRKWSEDGSQVVFMLDSHNFLFAKPDEEIEVVEASSTFYNAEFQAKRLAEDAKTMASKPAPKPPSEVETLRSQLSTLRGELEEARGERDRLAANNAHRISTGADLNWTSASDAAAEILKQTQSAGYTPPEAVDIHQMRVGRVCEQLDKLIGALKISAPVKRALAKERERLSAWLNKEAAAMEFASKHAPTNREARSCDAEAKTLRQVAKDLRTDDHHADEAGEK